MRLANLLNEPWTNSFFLSFSIHRQCVAGRGWGCWVVLETYSAEEFTLCFWPDSEPTKLLYRPKQKPRRGWRPQTDKHLPQSSFTGQFFHITTFGIAFLLSISLILHLSLLSISLILHLALLSISPILHLALLSINPISHLTLLSFS